MSFSFVTPFVGALTLNIGAWIISSFLRTDKFYDLTGSLSYLFTLYIGLSTISSSSSSSSSSVLPVSGTHYIAALMLSIWAIRLGTFLFTRILHDGADRRLQPYLNAPFRFLILWFMQTLWVYIGTLPILGLYSLSTTTVDTVGGLSSIVPVLLTELQNIPGWSTGEKLAVSGWLMGFLIETVADYQKRIFRNDTRNHEQFITTGLWKYSRHPNYLGQIILAWSLAIYCYLHYPNDTSTGIRLLCLAPLFETWLLLRLSGIPLLERLNDKKWNNDSNYQRYKQTTAILIPYVW